MNRRFVYVLSGKTGLTSGRSLFFISQLKKAGVLFPFHPEHEIKNGRFLFHTTGLIADEILESARKLIQGEGVKDAKIEKVASYLSKS